MGVEVGQPVEFDPGAGQRQVVDLTRRPIDVAVEDGPEAVARTPLTGEAKRSNPPDCRHEQDDVDDRPAGRRIGGPGDLIARRRPTEEGQREPGEAKDAQDPGQPEEEGLRRRAASVAGPALRRHPEADPAAAEQRQGRGDVRGHPNELEGGRQDRPVAATAEDAQRKLAEEEGQAEEGNERQRLRPDRHRSGDEDDDRQEQVAERAPGVEPAEERRRVGEPLRDGQARHGERVLAPEDLHRPGSPA